MTLPRAILVDAEQAHYYQITSRCVRRGFLLGFDRFTRKDVSHRKQWLEDRLLHLAQYFAVEVHAWAIMTNHFHLVVFYDPIACRQWSDAEVAQRWVDAFPPREDGKVNEALKTFAREGLLLDPKRLAACRKKLGCLSTFMKHLKQPIATRANAEDEVTGHFFEGRFYSGVILDAQALITTMAYVDLNAVRAQMTDHLAGIEHASISRRLQRHRVSREGVEAYLGPMVSGLSVRERDHTVTVSAYIEMLTSMIEAEGSTRTAPVDADAVTRWRARFQVMKRRQRAYGRKDALLSWLAARNLRPLELPLPD